MGNVNFHYLLEKSDSPVMKSMPGFEKNRKNK